MEREGTKPWAVGAPNAPMALLSSVKSATRYKSGYQLASITKMSTKANYGKVAIYCFYNLSAILKH